MAIINFTNKSTGQASTFETGSGKFLRLEDSQGAVHLFAASEITLSGTNGTVTAGQTLDLSTLLTVPTALASKTVSWSKTSGSDKLTLSGAVVTAASGATDSDSATFTATVAGISATVTVTATAEAEPEEPDEPAGAATLSYNAKYTSSSGTGGILLEFDTANMVTTLSNHNPKEKTDAWNNRNKWTVSNISSSGTISGFPRTISITGGVTITAEKSSGAAYTVTTGNATVTAITKDEWITQTNVGVPYDCIFVEPTGMFPGTTGGIEISVTMEW